MKNFKFKIKNVKLAFALLIILAIVVLLLFYHFVLADVFSRNNFANQMIELSDENETSVFNIQKVLLYSDANAIDNSEDHSLKNMSICQFTDLSIYLDNSSSNTELSSENTVKELYIDNINMTSKSDVGTKILNYKNPMNFGKYKNIKELDNGRIDFKVINTNQENESQNYSEPTFYTDCSNPITLGYLNKDIVTNYSVSDASKSISFNGKVLKEANVSLDDINYTLNFTIHIVNNLNQKFAYNMKLDVNLNDDNGGIYNGYTYKGKTTSGSEYRFFKEI
ncbi:MAG: hypothetical protein V8R81_09850 [Clostridia bacterium]